MAVQETKVVDGKFSCGACGKRYKWKPELVGKRAKCACGSAIVVPAAEAPIPDFDRLYDFAEPQEPPVAAKATVLPPTPVQPPSRAIPYRSAPPAAKPNATDGELSTFRDLYLPVGLLGLGFAAMMGWAVEGIGAGTAGAVFIAVFTVISTVVKTAILLGLAMIIAPWAGIIYRGVGKGALKLAAIIVFTDAADLWLDFIMRATGARRPGYISLRLIFASLALAAVLIGFLARLLFDTDAEETKTFAMPLAILSQFIGFVMKVIVVVVILAIVGASRPSRSGGSSFPGPSGSGVQPSPGSGGP